MDTAEILAKALRKIVNRDQHSSYRSSGKLLVDGPYAEIARNALERHRARQAAAKAKENNDEG